RLLCACLRGRDAPRRAGALDAARRRIQGLCRRRAVVFPAAYPCQSGGRERGKFFLRAVQEKSRIRGGGRVLAAAGGFPVEVAFLAGLKATPAILRVRKQCKRDRYRHTRRNRTSVSM